MADEKLHPWEDEGFKPLKHMLFVNDCYIANALSDPAECIGLFRLLCTFHGAVEWDGIAARQFQGDDGRGEDHGSRTPETTAKRSPLEDEAGQKRSQEPATRVRHVVEADIQCNTVLRRFIWTAGEGIFVLVGKAREGRG